MWVYINKFTSQKNIYIQKELSTVKKSQKDQSRSHFLNYLPRFLERQLC